MEQPPPKCIQDYQDEEESSQSEDESRQEGGNKSECETEEKQMEQELEDAKVEQLHKSFNDSY